MGNWILAISVCGDVLSEMALICLLASLIFMQTCQLHSNGTCKLVVTVHFAFWFLMLLFNLPGKLPIATENGSPLPHLTHGKVYDVFILCTIYSSDIYH